MADLDFCELRLFPRGNYDEYMNGCDQGA